MSILDTFKKKKGTPSPATQKPAVQKTAEKTVREELAVTSPAKKAVMTVPGGSVAHAVLLRPGITEKTAHLHSQNQYVFEIDPRSTKKDVRRAIVEAYNVSPEKIRIMRNLGKEVRRGRFVGMTSQTKKAIVSMPKGTTLSVYEGV